ncbi:unnamed protein product, partial [Closterium sp. Naga37s-1]
EQEEQAGGGQGGPLGITACGAGAKLLRPPPCYPFHASVLSHAPLPHTREQEEQAGGKVTPWTSLHVGQVLRCYALPSADAAHPAFSLHSTSTPFSNHG